MKRKINRCGVKKNDVISSVSWFRSGLALLLSACMLIALFYCMLWTWHWFRNPRTLPFKTLKIITSSHYVDSKKLQQLVESNLTGGFFCLNEELIRDVLLTDPWVKSVGLRRVFPATLIVSVGEYQPVAFWQDQWILTQSGQLISPHHLSHLSLPHFSGPIDAVQDVLTIYSALTKMLVPLHFSIVKLVLSDRMSWRLQLSNGLDVVLGRENILPRFQQFVTTYPKIMARHGGVMHRIDLRYTNGMAVSWSGVMES